MSLGQLNNHMQAKGFPGGTSGKEPPAHAGDIRDAGSIPGSERSPRGGQDNPLQYSCLENPRDRGAWRAAVHGVLQSQTWLKQLSIHAHAKVNLNLTCYENNSKWILSLRCKMCKTLRRKHGRKSSWPGIRQRVLRSATKTQSIKQPLQYWKVINLQLK